MDFSTVEYEPPDAPLHVAVGAAGATAGCGYRLTGPVERRTFDICDGDCDWADRTPDPGE